VSETGLVYTFTTPKLQPLVTKPEGKNLIQASDIYIARISHDADFFLCRHVSMLPNQLVTKMVSKPATSPILPKMLPPFPPTTVACLAIFLKVVICLSSKSPIHTTVCKLRVVNMPACLECLNISAVPSRLIRVDRWRREQNVVS
jgi:hypothetical protein